MADRFDSAGSTDFGGMFLYNTGKSANCRRRGWNRKLRATIGTSIIMDCGSERKESKSGNVVRQSVSDRR